MDSVNRHMIVILGMHRSGTSCLTGSLQKAGLFLGRHHTWNRHNKRGNRENPDVVALHEDILAFSRGSWKHPPVKTVWSEEHLERGRALIDENGHQGMWGFKDPRTLLTLEGWKGLNRHITFIGIFRHPGAVERSLKNRGAGIGLAGDEAFDLYCHYNRILLEEYRRNPFPVLSFDWEEEIFHRKLNAVMKSLGLSEMSPENRFYDAGLRNHRPQKNAQAPDRCMKVYHALQQIAL